MSIEVAIQNLADAINGLATAYRAAPAPASADAVVEDRPTTQRKRTAKDDKGPDAAAEVQERMQALSDAAKGGTIDAGTGKPVEEAAAPAVDRDGAKKKAGLLMVAPGGNDALTTLLRKHSGITDGAVKFGNVPDEAIPAFVADVDAQLALAD